MPGRTDLDSLLQNESSSDVGSHIREGTDAKKQICYHYTVW